MAVRLLVLADDMATDEGCLLTWLHSPSTFRNRSEEQSTMKRFRIKMVCEAAEMDVVLPFTAKDI